jgi:methylenetetrahydrofolate dehydrogenase (NADP+)/methenyltetrahydrofolate cyclohydrolase
MHKMSVTTFIELAFDKCIPIKAPACQDFSMKTRVDGAILGSPRKLRHAMINTIEFSGVALAHTLSSALRETEAAKKHNIVVFRNTNNAPASAYADRIAATAPSAGFTVDIRDYPTSRNEFEDLLDEISVPILSMHPIPDWITNADLVHLVGLHRDVEGAHPMHAGALALGHSTIVPPTAQAAFSIAEHLCGSLVGKTVCVIGASTIVGRPLALLLIAAEATVRVAQAATVDLNAQTQDADIVICAVGVPGLLTGSNIRKNAICIDVGITRVGERILGDFDLQSVQGKASILTAVPDGVGPLTVANLFVNAHKLISGSVI